MAAGLGSDVPFFLEGGTAVGTSRGEILEHFELHMPYWILTATPNIHISTSWAYSNVRPNARAGYAELRTIVEKSLLDSKQMRAEVRNDFEEPVFRHHLDIAQLKETLDQTGSVFSQMSGSGSSVYGFFESRTSALEAKAKVPPSFATSLTAPGFRPIQSSQSMTKIH